MTSHVQGDVPSSAGTHSADLGTLEALPPSAKLVLWVMEREGSMTQSTLAEQTRLPKRTVRDALERLRAIDVIAERPYFRDARQSLYTLTATE